MIDGFSEFCRLMESPEFPLYVSVKPDKQFARALQQIITEYKIPKPHDMTKLHCTLMYSRKRCIWPTNNPTVRYKGKFDKFDVFKTKDGSRVLVALINSPELEARHKELMELSKGSYDYPTFIPHVTISYDIGTFNEKTINTSMIPSVVFSSEKAELLSEEIEE